MQRPTCTNVRIRSTRDAHIIFHAVSLGILPIITRRLDADERAALRSGCVYAWEERGPHTEVTGLGIERFTEGRRWGPSRVRDEFLFYYEKSPPTHLRDKENPMLDELRRKRWDPLVKQTYSVWVDGPRGRRKWHLTAYFTQATVDRLETVDDLPQLANLDVPPGKYISTRLGKQRRPEDTQAGTPVHDVFRPANMSATRTYAPFPLPYEVTPPHHLPPNNVSAPSPTGVAAAANIAPAREDQANSTRYFYGATPAHHPRYPDNPLTLPPIHALAPTLSSGPSDRRYQSYSPSYEYPSPQDGPSSAYPQQQQQQQHQYAPYPPPPNVSANTRSPTTGPNYFPPTPTSSTSQYASPVYPPAATPSGLPIPEHPQINFSSVAPYPSPYPSPSTQYPTVQASHAYSENHPLPINNQPQYIQEKQLSPPRLSPPMIHPSQLHPDLRASPPPLTPTESLASPYPSSPALDNQDLRPTAQRPTLTIESPLLVPRLSPPMSEVRDEHQNGDVSPNSASSMNRRLDLAPLRSLVRQHPYRRDNFDHKALMAFTGRKASE